jgi:hypothetical protein
MKKLIACLAVLLLSGCIEFEKQTLVFRHYPETNTLVIWQHYEGIHGEDNEHDLSKKEREQLHSVVNGQRTFFFGNWITEYNAEYAGQAITELEAELKNDIKPKAKADDARQLLALAELVKKSVTITNGPFYLNQQNRLSATQHVIINNVGRIIRKTNIALQASILRGDEPFGGFEEGDPNVEMLEKSAHAKMNYLTLKGQQLRFQWPLTRRNFRELEANDMNPFRKAGVTFEHKNDLLTITFGKVKAAESSVSVKLPGMAFQPNATAAISERYGLAKDFNPAKARAEFFKDSDVHYLKK